MARTSGARLPAGVKLLRKRIDEWRRTRDRRTAMPADMWDEAVAFTRGGRRAGARALRVSFETLRRRATEAGRQGSGCPATLAFVDVSDVKIVGAAATGTSGGVVELSDGGGMRLTMRLAAEAAFDAARIVATFLEAGT